MISFINRLGDILAKIFHPVLLVFYFMIACELGDNSVYANLILGITLSLIVLIPIIFIYFYSKGDLHLSNRGKRSFPLIVTSICYGLNCLALHLVFHRHTYDALLMAVCAIGLFLCFLVNLRFKISLHACCYASMAPFIIILLFPSCYNDKSMFPLCAIIAALLLLIFIIVLRQRVVSGSHKLSEVLAGFILGFLTSMLCMGWFNGYLYF